MILYNKCMKIACRDCGIILDRNKNRFAVCLECQKKLNRFKKQNDKLKSNE